MRRQRPGEDDDDTPFVLPAIPDFPVGVLPSAASELVAYAAGQAIPPALTAGACLAALAAAVGPLAVISRAGWHQRAVLWVPLIGPRGAGKSPAQMYALGPIREHDRAAWGPYQEELERWACLPDKQRRAEPMPRDPTVLYGDCTLEALERRLAWSDGAAAIDLDELTQLLRGLGEYKRGGGGDRGRLLGLWTGEPWRTSRISRGDAMISRPTVVIVGGLQPALHGLLGSEEDGLRPRWLPHLAGLPAGDMPSERGDDEPPADWAELLQELLEVRGQPRVWRLAPAAERLFAAAQRGWKTGSRGDVAASTSAALVKADIHLLRVALVLAEADLGGVGGQVTADTVERAACWVDFVLDCWRALPEQGALALSLREERLGTAVERLLAYLEEHGGQATSRQLLRNRVGGCASRRVLDEVLDHFEEMFPGTVVEYHPARGPAARLVTAPRRQRRASSPETVAATVSGEASLRPGGDAFDLSGASPSDGARGQDVALGARQFESVGADGDPDLVPIDLLGRYPGDGWV